MAILIPNFGPRVQGEIWGSDPAEFFALTGIGHLFLKPWDTGGEFAAAPTTGDKIGYAAPKASYPARFQMDLVGTLSERRIRHQYPLELRTTASLAGIHGKTQKSMFLNCVLKPAF